MSKRFVISPTGRMFSESDWDVLLPLPSPSPTPITFKEPRPTRRHVSQTTVQLADGFMDHAIPCSELLELAMQSPRMTLNGLLRKINQGQVQSIEMSPCHYQDTSMTIDETQNSFDMMPTRKLEDLTSNEVLSGWDDDFFQ